MLYPGPLVLHAVSVQYTFILKPRRRWSTAPAVRHEHIWLVK